MHFWDSLQRFLGRLTGGKGKLLPSNASWISKPLVPTGKEVTYLLADDSRNMHHTSVIYLS